eukprot:907741-Amphidinium_carterae.2
MEPPSADNCEVYTEDNVPVAEQLFSKGREQSAAFWNGCQGSHGSVTLKNKKVAALGNDGETASLSSDCLQEDQSSSDVDDFTWESFEPTKCPQAFKPRGFASDLEKWSF